MLKRNSVAVAAALLVSSLAVTAQESQPQQLERIEVTGSRIKRAESEGALPVTSFKREDLDNSGATTVAEFVRNLTFSSGGNLRPQSGSSAQAVAEVDLRGLGSARTLVLIDGRRVAKSPATGQAADMNTVPLAAVERIEILTDGASAIYGSDAIGGVINIILRKDFEGLEVKMGKTQTDIKGGDREEASAIMGVVGEKGRMIAGVSKSTRDIIFVRDYPWGYTQGRSSFSNNKFRAYPDGHGGYEDFGVYLGRWVGECNNPEKGFFVSGGRCRYDFNLVAADEAATDARSVFARGEVRINKDWSAYMAVSNSESNSFGRYAPVPDSLLVSSPAALAKYGETSPFFVWHRFAAAGNRDTTTNNNLFDASVGFQGTIGGMDVDFGVRRTTSKFIELGRGFIVKNLAQEAINNLSYDLINPFNNPDSLLKSFTTTTNRDSQYRQTEIYGNVTTDLFKMGGGMARLYVGAEHRTEDYADIYDSLSEAGQVLGSSGNSSGGGRNVDAVSTELFMPIAKGLEASFAARYEKYSDYGNDFSPKASIRYQPMRSLTLRGSVGRGFRAPTLDITTQKPAFSADSIIDLRHCKVNEPTFTDADCAENSFQINGLRIANPTLKSEKSKQFSLGAVWDATNWMSITADYWNTTITNTISFIDAQTIVDRNNGADPRPIPSGLSIRRDPVTGAIGQIVSGYANEGEITYSGVDLSVLLQHKYAGIGKFFHRLGVSHLIEADQDGTDYVGVFGLPSTRVALANGWSMGAFSAVWNINMIGQNGSGALDVNEYITHDLQGTWNTPLKGTSLTLGVINVENKQPQRISTSSKPFNYSLYDAYGRQVQLTLKAKF
ncbi:TonB-dependent receptor plug domain-containing protein [Inhella gelatinilytica]|uniref:TonB-dependent receptor n=1 Tax=Inhella gelatinilytica TaxID=2795030 RepID=A0A931IXL8_9BURK|nr:TonB-dependent receptor [Inhella gelatinilytica]MBH9551716.1 TonB-dependent receptor [Inhella gelatinilytica]